MKNIIIIVIAVVLILNTPILVYSGEKGVESIDASDSKETVSQDDAETKSVKIEEEQEAEERNKAGRNQPSPQH